MLQKSADRPSPAVSPPETERHDYLAYVDGLRAVSILAVVAFHVGLPGASGGYVGVDVFFVISGFLIINQIRANLEAGRFSILDFYARRGLRIVPPYLLMLLALLIVAPFVLTTPTVYLEFLKQAAFSPLMLSNFLFYRMFGYFDLLADQKPLLHTWTLSIEEQFYLVAPVLLMLTFLIGRRQFGRMAVAVALVLVAISLAGAIAFTDMQGRNAAFYFPQWRAWEFIVGGLIGREVAAALARLPRAMLGAIGLAGLACILVAATTFDPSTPFPSWRAVLPVAGAMLVIAAGLADAQNLAARFLSLRFMVAIGLVSYGWYLWHWPILSLMRIARVGEASLLPDLIGGGLVAFIIACLSYRYVELPIRRWRRNQGASMPSGRIVASGVTACLVFAAIGAGSGYAGYRMSTSFIEARYSPQGRGALDNGCVRLGLPEIPRSCFEGKFGLLFGDSHAQMLTGSFTRGFQDMGVRLVSLTRPGCFPMHFGPEGRKENKDSCGIFVPDFERALKPPAELDFVIFASFWTEVTPEEIADLVSQFDLSRTRILFIGRVPRFERAGLDCVALSDRFGLSRDRCLRPRAAVEAENAELVNAVRPLLERSNNARLLDTASVFCDAKMCRPFHGDTVLFSDAHHVLPSGADRIFDAFRPAFEWAARRN